MLLDHISNVKYRRIEKRNENDEIQQRPSNVIPPGMVILIFENRLVPDKILVADHRRGENMI